MDDKLMTLFTGGVVDEILRACVRACVVFGLRGGGTFGLSKAGISTRKPATRSRKFTDWEKDKRINEVGLAFLCLFMHGIIFSITRSAKLADFSHSGN